MDIMTAALAAKLAGDGGSGTVPNIQVGNVETLLPGESAYVERRAGSPDSAPILDFGIPQGEDGQEGDTGSDGIGISSVSADGWILTLSLTDGTTQTVDLTPNEELVRNVTFMDGMLSVEKTDGSSDGYEVGTGISIVDWGEKASRTFNAVFQPLAVRAMVSPGIPVSVYGSVGTAVTQSLLQRTLFAFLSGYPLWVISVDESGFAIPVNSIYVADGGLTLAGGSFTRVMDQNDTAFLVKAEVVILANGIGVMSVTANSITERITIPTVYTDGEVEEDITLAVEAAEVESVKNAIVSMFDEGIEGTFTADYVNIGSWAYTCRVYEAYSDSSADCRTTYDGRAYTFRVDVETDTETGESAVYVSNVMREYS